MNEYDDILNRIVEEFYDTGRLVLNEVGGFQLRTVREIGGLSWEIFNTNQKVSGSQKEVNNYISMIEKFLTLNDHHKRIITEKNWWKPNDYVNIIDRYLNDTNRPIKDKLDFHNRIKEISDKLDNTPFSELKDIIKPFETFLRSKDELEKKQEDETPEVEKDLYVPDNTEETGDTEQTPEGETEVEEKRDITSIAKEVVNFGRVKTALSIESDKILNTLIGDPKVKEDIIKIIDNLNNDIIDLKIRIGEIQKLTGNDRVDSRKEVEEKIILRNDKEEELKEYEQELKDLELPIIYQLLNKKCLINTLLYGVNDSVERRELVNILKERFVKPLSQYGDVSTYSLHSTHFNKFKNKYGEEWANKIKRYIKNPGMKPSETDKELEFCGVEEFDNTKIISRKKEEINNEYQGKDEKKISKIKQLLNQAFNLVNEIFNEFMSNTQLQQKYAKTERYNKLIDIIKNYWSGDNDDERLYSLYNIIFDLNELLKLIKGLKGDRITDNIDDLINNIYKNVNDSDVIVDNFKKIRENNNLDYEKSFGCDDDRYFKYATGGDTSAILGRDVNNNQILKNMMNIIITSMEIPETYIIKDKDGNVNSFNSQNFIDEQSFTIGEIYQPNFSTETYEKKIEWCVDILYDNIGYVDVDKYDIISTSPVNVVSDNENIVIPRGSKIEVKDADSREYHLSEFFGVYKDSKLPLGYKKIPQYRKIYNDIIKGLYEKIKINDKGIIDKISTSTEGLFFRNYKYIPLERKMLSWSLDGRVKKSEGMDEYRLTVRVDMSEEDTTEYQWTTENGNCNCEPFLKGVKCPQNESTDRIDNIIENFFDTGNFDI